MPDGTFSGTLATRAFDPFSGKYLRETNEVLEDARFRLPHGIRSLVACSQGIFEEERFRGKGRRPPEAT